MQKLSRSIITIAVVSTAAFLAAQTYAGDGIFGGYLELTVNASPTGSWYAIDDPGAIQITAIPGAPSALNLGTVSVLTMDDAEVLTYKNGSSDVDGANVFYRLIDVTTTTTGSFTTVGLPFGQNNPPTDAAGNSYNTSGNQIWGGTTIPGDDPYNTGVMATQNVLSALAPGTYLLNLYENSPANDGTNYLNNGGSNYNVEFTIVPEPSSIMLVSVGLLGAIGLIRRRKA